MFCPELVCILIKPRKIGGAIPLVSTHCEKSQVRTQQRIEYGFDQRHFRIFSEGKHLPAPLEFSGGNEHQRGTEIGCAEGRSDHVIAAQSGSKKRSRSLNHIAQKIPTEGSIENSRILLPRTIRKPKAEQIWHVNTISQSQRWHNMLHFTR